MKINNVKYDDFYDFILNETGLKNIETNKNSINRFIDKRLNILKKNYIEYLNILKNNINEREAFFNTATVNETYFFREEKHFIILNNKVLVELFKQKNYINVLSLACSSGEEAISLALIIYDYIKNKNEKSFNIYGYDINTDLLKEYKNNEYKNNSFRQDGSTFHYLLDQYGNHNNHNWKMNQNLKKYINLSYLNIMKEDFDNSEVKYDIIFFRNTLIYMNKKTKNLIINKITDKLNNNGYLFLGMSEIPGITHNKLNLNVSNNTYYFKKEEKKSDSEKQKVNEAYPVNNIQIKTKLKKKEYNVLEVIKYANLIHNKSVKKKLINNTNYLIAEYFTTVIKYINKNQIKKAVNILKEFKKSYFTKEIFSYLFGFIFMLKNKNKTALKYFEESSRINEYFWLSKFYTAKIQTQDNKKDALLHFESCLKIINQMEINNQANIYNFLTDNFNEKYFKNMCESWINKLK